MASFVARALRERACEADVFDHGKTPLPIWTPDLSTGDGDGSINRVREQAGRADAFVCVIPEYSGMAAPAFKNIILMMSDEHMGHKPALLVGVSAGMGGAYPIAELRMSSYKNTRLLWIPENVIVRFADNFAQVKKAKKTKKTRPSCACITRLICSSNIPGYCCPCDRAPLSASNPTPLASKQTRLLDSLKVEAITAQTPVTPKPVTSRASRF